MVRAGVMNRNDKAASAQEEAEGAVESFLLPRGKEKKGGGGFSRDMRVMGSPAAGCERAAGESEYRVGGVQGLVLWFGGVRAHRRWGGLAAMRGGLQCWWVVQGVVVGAGCCSPAAAVIGRQ